MTAVPSHHRSETRRSTAMRSLTKMTAVPSHHRSETRSAAMTTMASPRNDRETTMMTTTMTVSINTSTNATDAATPMHTRSSCIASHHIVECKPATRHHAHQLLHRPSCRPSFRHKRHRSRVSLAALRSEVLTRKRCHSCLGDWQARASHFTVGVGDTSCTGSGLGSVEADRRKLLWAAKPDAVRASDAKKPTTLVTTERAVWRLICRRRWLPSGTAVPWTTSVATSSWR